ncbi:MAG: putative Zn-dependent protease [Chlamydiales bacterium]|jgi:predicted Zn-dependent protease
MTDFDPFAAEHEFPGGIVGKTVPGGRRPARVRVTTSGLEAETEDGEGTRIPWHRAVLSRAGSSGEITFCTGGDGISVYSEDENFLRAIEGCGGNDVANEVARLQGERVSSRAKHLAGCTIFLVLSSAIVFFTPRACHGSIDKMVDALPYSVDETIGEAVVDAMDAGGSEVEDEELRAGIQTILDRLTPHTGLPDAKFEFRIIDNEQVNAFALPGGYLTIYTGLIEQAESADMVAGVLAHEIAHVTRRHGLRRIAHSVGTFAGLRLLLGDTSGLLGIATELFTLASVNDYSQEQETDADEEGTRILVDAQVDPHGLIAFFEHIEELQGELPAALEWLSTHPETGGRIASVRSRIAELDEREALPFDIDWEALRERVRD